MDTTSASERFTALPDDESLGATVVALEEHGFGVEVVDDLDAARAAVLARIPEGTPVMTNTSVTLQETGIAAAIDDGGPYESARNAMLGLDYATQLPEMKAIAGQPEYALGSVHAVTRDGTLVIASASGSQLASYAWGAANVIFVARAQKLVPSPEAARERIIEHSLSLALIDQAAREAGRDPSEIRRIYNVPGAFTSTAPAAARDTDDAIVGPPDHWSDVLIHLALDVGFDTFVLMGPPNPQMLRAFIEEVAPAVRERVARAHALAGAASSQGA